MNNCPNNGHTPYGEPCTDESPCGSCEPRPKLAYTDAPDFYDYWYVKTLATKTVDGKPWRLISYTDPMRFSVFQTPRYNSGLYIVVGPGTLDAIYFKLDEAFCSDVSAVFAAQSIAREGC